MDRLTHLKVLFSRSPGRDPVLKVDRLTHLEVLYSRSPGRDPVLKGDRLTHLKGTRVEGPILKGPCTTG